jgi:hypothetical protein
MVTEETVGFKLANAPHQAAENVLPCMRPDKTSRWKSVPVGCGLIR